ncbi:MULTISPECIES: hypothetical protein [Acinetobacter]|uniref:hypothetical protein n=1 Tax=Acinetobacter TaxID=469 RepID=UPI0006FD80DD|nr:MULTISPECIES: hypothetical protein [Acinetobacter]KQX03302.1 hypothetical protein ASC84_00955 [Acinetobacter sp. Root1280]
MKIKSLSKIILCAVISLNTGCAAVMATKQPTKKDLSIFNKGVDRSLIIAEIGAPITSEFKNGKRYEIYTFMQGYSKANKISRAVWHGAADVVTFGLWEIIGTPTESAFNGKKTSYEMIFDADDHLESSKLLTMSEYKNDSNSAAEIEVKK